jgi:hypothetical protein
VYEKLKGQPGRRKERLFSSVWKERSGPAETERFILYIKPIWKDRVLRGAEMENKPDCMEKLQAWKHIY